MPATGTSTSTETPVALVLAAGLGTRMRSARAKVLHPVLGRPMVEHVVRTASEVAGQVLAVVHHQEEAVRAALAPTGCGFVRQGEPRGTGHAVLSAVPALPERGILLVLCGDVPLLRPETLTALLEAHGAALCTVVTAVLEDAGAFGRIVRDDKGRVAAIVEAAEATPEQLALREINTGTYAFDIAWAREVLPRLQPHPPKNELYLTDLVALAAEEGRLRALVHGDSEELAGVNDRWALSQVAYVLQQRVLAQHARAGVTFENPATVSVDVGVTFGRDVTVGPGCVLRGETRVGNDVALEPHVFLQDATVEDGATVLAGTVIRDSRLAPGSSAGPMAHLRGRAVLERDSSVGNFVEVKKTRLGAGAKAKHLSYLGDGDVGEGANIGAGTIFCNYDGKNKHPTVLGRGVFVGSNSTLIAPVSIGDGAFVAGGSTITEDVEAGALALGRARQVTKPGRAPKLEPDD